MDIYYDSGYHFVLSTSWSCCYFTGYFLMTYHMMFDVVTSKTSIFIANTSLLEKHQGKNFNLFPNKKHTFEFLSARWPRMIQNWITNHTGDLDARTRCRHHIRQHGQQKNDRSSIACHTPTNVCDACKKCATIWIFIERLIVLGVHTFIRIYLHHIHTSWMWKLIYARSAACRDKKLARQTWIEL